MGVPVAYTTKLIAYQIAKAVDSIITLAITKVIADFVKFCYHLLSLRLSLEVIAAITKLSLQVIAEK